MDFDIRQFPKIELHLHLDCSLSFEVVQRIDPRISMDTYQQHFVGPVKCTDLNDFLDRTKRGVELLQTKEALRWATLDLFQQLHRENVIYAEIRFAPFLHLQGGLNAHEVVETVNGAVTEGMAETGIIAGLILCTLRHFVDAQSMGTVQLVQDFANKHVVGFDIASDEAGFPVDEHLRAFEFAKANNIPVTAHAGEAKGPDSVWETLKCFHPRRIGHGVRSVEDPHLMEFLKQKGIHLEICPTSNVQTNVVPAIQQHPVNTIYNLGVSLSLSTDGRTVTNTTLEKEYFLMQTHFNWQKAHFLRCNLEAIEHAFTSDEMKDSLRKQILSAYR